MAMVINFALFLLLILFIEISYSLYSFVWLFEIEVLNDWRELSIFCQVLGSCGKHLPAAKNKNINIKKNGFAFDCVIDEGGILFQGAGTYWIRNALNICEIEIGVWTFFNANTSIPLNKVNIRRIEKKNIIIISFTKETYFKHYYLLK